MRLPLITIIILFVLSILIDVYITSDVRHFSAKRNRTRNTLIYIATALLCIALLVVAVCIPLKSADSNILTVMWLLYTFLTIYVSKLVYCIFSLIGRAVNMKSRRLVNYGAMAGVPAALIVCIVMWWGVIFTRHEINVNKVEVVSNRLPAGFDGYRIVQFSDAHVGTWGNDTAFISSLVNKINSLHPDLIVFTGDIVNRETVEMKPFLPVLKNLKAKDGVYSILGNHDYGDYVTWPTEEEHQYNNKLLGKWEKQVGWTLLNNSHVFLHHGNDSIALIGVENWGEPPFRQYGDLFSAYNASGNKAALYDDNYKILLTHNPTHWDAEVRKASNIDLTMSGHTHAMQFMIELGDFKWSPISWRYKQWGGMYEEKAKDGTPMNLYVNIGSGEVAIPSRVGAVPEVTLLTLKSDKSSK